MSSYDDALRLLRTGVSYAEAARQSGVPESTLYSIARERDLPRRRRGRKAQAAPSERNVRILAAIKAGRTYRDIGAEFGLSVARIAEIRNRWRWT